MFDQIQKAEDLLSGAVAELDPEVLDPAAARKLVEQFARIERLAAGGKTLALRRVETSGAWRVTGERSAAHWVARRTGTSVGNAINTIETAKRLAELPATDQALRAGKLSEVQAKEIASAAAASPAAEQGLLKAAEVEGVAGLKERCARVRAAADTDELERNEAIRRSRYLRHWSDSQGAFRLDGRFTPDAGARILAALEPYVQKIFAAARKEKRLESYESFRADALESMARDSAESTEEGTARKGPPAMIHVRVDHSALVRGSTQEGEVCEIPGVGPIPVATARTLAADAFIAAILSDGADIKAVAHLGRNIPSKLRTALLARDPKCVVPGCEETRRLEIDHITPVAKGGETRLDNLARLCVWHHYLKTHQGYRLSGIPGKWEWVHPFRSERGDEGPDFEDPDENENSLLPDVSSGAWGRGP
ncbi:MAG: DUF222 domain-containing protein [Actinomycetota bacterium]